MPCRRRRSRNDRSRESHLAGDDALRPGCRADHQRSVIRDLGRDTTQRGPLGDAAFDHFPQQSGAASPLAERRDALVVALDPIELARHSREQRETIDRTACDGERGRAVAKLDGKVLDPLMHVDADTKHEHPTFAVRCRVSERDRYTGERGEERRSGRRRSHDPRCQEARSLRRVPRASTRSLPGTLLVGDDDATRRAAGGELARSILGRPERYVKLDRAPELALDSGPHRAIGEQRQSRQRYTCAPAARARSTRPRPGAPCAAAVSSIATTTRDARRAGAIATTLGPAPDRAAPKAPASRADAIVSAIAGTSAVRA